MIDKNKEYTTRDGTPVRIYATDGKGIYNIHGAIYHEGWVNIIWYKDGKYFSGVEHELDLIEKGPKFKEGDYVKVTGGVHKGKEGFLNPHIMGKTDSRGDYLWQFTGQNAGFTECEIELATPPCPFEVGDWVKCEEAVIVAGAFEGQYGRVECVQPYDGKWGWEVDIKFGRTSQTAHLNLDTIVKA